MQKLKSCFFISMLVFTVFCSVVCQAPPEIPNVLIEAESFTNSSGNVAVVTCEEGGKSVTSDKAGDWLAYEVNIPVAGRYRTEIRVSRGAGTSEPGSCWIEDYYDNTDDRTYNITAAMPVSGTSSTETFVSIAKEGSPLNAGTHKMKLHFDGGSIDVNWIKFTLMKEHRSTPVTQIQNMQGSEWALVWSDEFEGTGLPDTSKWTFDIGNWGWGNKEPQYYTEYRSENARQEDGNLIIEARKNDMGQAWTSARLTTRGKISFLYGKIEFRARVPVGDGTWAAGWLLGDAYRDEISWPYCGEVDILECVGKEIDDISGDGINHASCHTRAYYFKQGNHLTGTIPVKNMRDEYHTYTVEWYPDGIHAYLDGVKYYTYDKLNGDWEWPFNQPQNLIINLAMGGGMGGQIDPGLTSQQVIIDYIRVYELK